jgi:hypothetical protein
MKGKEMEFKFTPATKEKSKLRLAVFGPSGSGKTYSALRIASGMSSKIAFIDSERGSASKYADRFNFSVLELGDSKSIDTYTGAIGAASAAGFDVLIIDSLSHAWQELLEEIDKLAKAKYRGNTWSAWSDGTPKQRQLVDAILAYPGHIIATMRSKTEWTTAQTSAGKSAPVRVGLAPEQGKGIEYEFDMLIELSTDHVANVIKDRTGKYQDKMITKPGEDFGKELIEWLNDGSAPVEKQAHEKKNDKPAEPVQEEQEEQPKTLTRPYEPEVLKRGIMDKAKSYKGSNPPQTTIGVVVANLEKCFAGGDAKSKRHEFLSWLTGKPSIKDVDGAVVLAMKDWLHAIQDSGGEWQPSAMAVKEANKALVAAEKDNGQETLI